MTDHHPHESMPDKHQNGGQPDPPANLHPDNQEPTHQNSVGHEVPAEDDASIDPDIETNLPEPIGDVFTAEIVLAEASPTSTDTPDVPSQESSGSSELPVMTEFDDETPDETDEEPVTVAELIPVYQPKPEPYFNRASATAAIGLGIVGLLTLPITYLCLVPLLFGTFLGICGWTRPVIRRAQIGLALCVLGLLIAVGKGIYQQATTLRSSRLSTTTQTAAAGLKPNRLSLNRTHSPADRSRTAGIAPNKDSSCNA